MILVVHDSAIFTNYLGLKRRLSSILSNMRRVIVDFENAWVVDHTVLQKLHNIGKDWTGRELILTGFDSHVPMSSHQLAARRKLRSAAA